ncbi:restriction endonuclease subunit S [Bifidobacterium pullorum]|uniref:restriction endonuclease subunit S n=1 Tax=Bifidobacterium pullorum TaxID=78448 RepID=UPI003F1F5DC9
MSNQPTGNNGMNNNGTLNAETQRKSPQGKILQPKLRFKGFTDPWQQRKYSDYLIESNIPGHDGSEANKLTVKLWGKGVVEKETVTAGSNATKYYIRHTGQLMYGKLDFLHAAFGLVPPELDGYESTADSPAFDILPSADPNFILMTCLSKHTYLYQGNLADGSRKAKRVHVPTFLDMSLNIPNIEEQYRIVLFLHTIDKLIAAAKKKADLLKLKKRYYLQAIFNQRLRFKGFTEPWQQRKLGELFKERSERSNQGELISVTITNGVVPASSLERKDNSSEDKSNYKQVKTGDIAYNTMRMWQGASGVSPYSGILSPAYTVLIPSSEVSSSFFAQMFKLVRMLHLFQRYSQGLTSDTWNLKYPLLSEIRVTIPSLAEQERISEFLVLNDELTALVKKKAEDLQKIKSYYLQQLFV